MQLIANMMTTKLTQKEMDANFHDWITDLVEEPGLEDFIKKPIIADLLQNRHVVIVDFNDFFPEAADDEDFDPDMPYIIFSKVNPAMFTDQFESLEVAIKFCADCGMTYEMYMAETSTLVH